MQLRHATTLLDDRRQGDRAAGAAETRTDHDDGLLRTAVPVMIGAYAGAVGIVTLTFWQSGEALLSIAICAVYMAMFFGVPILMSGIRNSRDARWQSSHPKLSSDHVSVFTGRLERTEALLQIVTVPLVVVFAFGAFAVIWVAVRP